MFLLIVICRNLICDAERESLVIALSDKFVKLDANSLNILGEKSFPGYDTVLNT